ncbi:ISPsy25, transposase, partial [Pseudomonas syringae pv. pisi str. 1704B]
GLYLAPPDKALVLYCNEKSQVQALERTQPGLPLGIGEMVSEASNAFTLSDLSRVWATFGVAPRDLD